MGVGSGMLIPALVETYLTIFREMLTCVLEVQVNELNIKIVYKNVCITFNFNFLIN